MKNIWILLLLISGSLMFNNDAYSQKKKKSKKKKTTKSEATSKPGEAKHWKKLKKQMNPMDFKVMYNEHQSLKGENRKLNKQVKILNKQINNNESVVSSNEEEIIKLKNKIAKLEQNNKSNPGKGNTQKDDFTKGIVYRVQIGAFRKIDLKVFLENPLLDTVWEVDEDGTKKYTIGKFRDYWKANEFKKYMRKMGVGDAWIVAYEDNKRKNINEVNPDIKDSKDGKK